VIASRIELVCPAGTLPALKAAVDHGADCVYMGFRNETNARNFAGLNFDAKAATEGIGYAHARGAKVLLALNTYPQPGTFARWTAALDLAADLGVDAVILADPGLMRYAAERHPELRLHCRCRARRPATRRSTSMSASSASGARCCRECFRWRR
jgi:putative protease